MGRSQSVNPLKIIGNKYNTLGVAHTHTCDIVFLAADNNRLVYDWLIAVGLDRDKRGSEFGFSHIDGCADNRVVFDKQLNFFYAREGFDFKRILFTDSVVVYKFGNTAHAVTAHFSFASVSVEHTHLRIRTIGRTNHYHSVTAD